MSNAFQAAYNAERATRREVVRWRALYSRKRPLIASLPTEAGDRLHWRLKDAAHTAEDRHRAASTQFNALWDHYSRELRRRAGTRSQRGVGRCAADLSGVRRGRGMARTRRRGARRLVETWRRLVIRRRGRINQGVGHGFDITNFLADPNLLGDYFTGASWDRWHAVLRAAFALPMSAHDLELFREVAERDPPRRPVKELIAVVGRGGGKDAIASGLAAYLAVTGDFSGLRPGERGTVFCVANTRDQAAIAQSYTRAYFDQVPLLRGMVEDKDTDKDALRLINGAQIIIGTNSLRAPRGLRICAAIYDEVGTWRSEDGLANIDVETDAAIAPGLLRHAGSLKIMISTPYRRSGLLYDRWRRFYGTDDDDVLVVLGTSLQFNETLDSAGIERELALDYERASSEFLCRWRDDLTSFIDRAAVEAVVARGCRERGPLPGIRYTVGCDPSGGRQDAMSLAIAHRDKDGTAVLDLLREVKPPFSPENAVEDFAAAIKPYRARELIGDNYAAEWNAGAFRKQGLRYTVSKADRSAVYRELLPLINAGKVALLDNDRLVNQLCALERRIARSGKDTINHPDRGHDDLINAAAIALVNASKGTSLTGADYAAVAAASSNAAAAGTADSRLWSMHAFAGQTPGDFGVIK